METTNLIQNTIEIQPRDMLSGIVFQEQIDVNKLKLILQEFKGELGERALGFNMSQEKLLTDYLKKFKKGNNVCEVKYSKSSKCPSKKVGRKIIKYGRVLPGKFLSLGSLRKDIRSTLVKDTHIDIDIVNCHPCILKQICIENGLNCKYLTQYVENREELLNNVINKTNVSREQAKQLFIRIMYGGKVNSWCKDNNVSLEGDYYKQLEKELNTITLNISRVGGNKDLHEWCVNNKEKYKINGSFLSYLLQEIENQILYTIYDYLNNNGYILDNHCSLCYDGILVKRIKNVEYNNELLELLSNQVEKKHGFKLGFSYKEMNEDLTSNLLLGMDGDCRMLLDNSNEMLNDFEMLMRYVLEDAKRNNYKKVPGYIMRPVKDCPIIYEQYIDFKNYVRALFKDLKKCDILIYRTFRKNVNYLSQIVKYLEDYDDEDLSFIKLNKNIIAFNNGYLNIEDLYDFKFNDYKDIKNINEIITSVYYNVDFDLEWLNIKKSSDIDTPIFDGLCNYHFQDKEILHIFYGMCGRLHYKVNQYDNFNGMLFIKGAANTGKSTTGNIIMNNLQNVGTISGKMEGTFGLQSLIDKDIIYNPDLNQNFVEKLDKGDFQRMIEGSNLDIPRKNLSSINNFKWTIPLFFLGNYLPEYKCSSGAIPRRVMVFYMDRFVNNRDTTLEKRCKEQEGYKILLKNLLCYRELLEKYGNKTWEDICMSHKQLKKGYEEMALDTNALYSFLTLEQGDYDCWVERSNDSYITKGNFKKIVDRYYKSNKINEKFKLCDTTLQRCNYEFKRLEVCGNCGSRTKKNCKGCLGSKTKRVRAITGLKIVYDDGVVVDDSIIE
jgi:hypothetical protein